MGCGRDEGKTAPIFGSLDALSKAGDAVVADVARRLKERKLYKTLDIAEFGEDSGRQRQQLRRIESQFEDQLKAATVMKDDKAAIGIYAEVGGDDDKMHKKLHILDAGKPVEISKLSALVHALDPRKQYTRLYFASKEDRDAARNARRIL